MESDVPPHILASQHRRGGGLLLSIALPSGAPCVSGRSPTADDFAPNAFVRIGRDGRITLIMSQVEMGQGTYTSMPMLIAEELEVDLSQVQVEHAPPDDRLYANPLVGFQVTGGSTSVRAFWKPLREAGAAARMLLVEAAAQTWGVDALVLPRRNRLCDPQRHQPQARLRRARGEGGNVAGARR